MKTAAAVAPGARPQFATEGAVLVGGAAVQWLRDGLGLIETAAESEALAREVDSTAGVFFVPALTGLGAPHWDAEARGLICGLTRGTTRAHLVRATLEAIAHQVADVIDVLPIEAGVLRADGGASANGFLMQFQADLIGGPSRWRPMRMPRRSELPRLPGSRWGCGATSKRLDRCAAGGAVRALAEQRGYSADAWRVAASVASRDGEPVTWVIAHRGASAEEQENTLPAFERAIELGADYVEFDVQAACDGGLVVFHDLTLDRLTPARGPLRRRPLAELRELGIPTLAEVLELTAQRIGVMVELKSPWLFRRHDFVARTVRLLPDDAVVVSFSRAAILETRRRRPACDRPARRLRDLDPGSRRLRVGRGFRRRSCDGARNREGQSLGLQALVYTVNEPSRLLALREMGVDGVFTDYPGLARETLARRPG